MNIIFTSNSAAESLLQKSSSSFQTLSVTQIVAYIKTVVDALCAELSTQSKQPALPIEQVVEYAKQRFLSADLSRVSDDFCSLSDDELRASIKEFLSALLSVGDIYYKEFAGLLKQIQEDDKFAQKFFYGNSVKPKESIAQIRSSLIAKTRRNYKIVLDDFTVASIIYAHLWQDGTWRSLKLFHFRSSFFYWLKKVSANAVNQFLKDNFLIQESTCLTPSNTRVVWKSKSPELCQLMLDELMQSSSSYSFLKAKMVDRLSDKEIMLNLKLKDFDGTLKIAEKQLKSVLLNSDHCFHEFITYKVAPKIMVSSDILTKKTDNTANPLSEIFDSKDHVDYQESLEKFVVDFSENFFDDPVDRIIFQRRFLYDADPVSLGLELGRKRSNIDCRYSRCKTEIYPAFRRWYASQSNPRKIA